MTDHVWVGDTRFVSYNTSTPITDDSRVHLLHPTEWWLHWPVCEIDATWWHGSEDVSKVNCELCLRMVSPND